LPRPACPKCGEKHCSRRNREGLIQLLIWPRLGWYPWQCGACRHVFIVKFRGKSKHKRPTDGQSPAAISTLPPNRHLSGHEEDFHDEDFDD
jgi:hypothetical protein